MAKIQARILRGFRDYLPADMIPRRAMFSKVEDVFRIHGFAPLLTPALEYSECLLGKYGDEGDKLLYRFEDNGGRDIALRYDLTVPLARMVAMNGGLTLPFKRYQIAPVWRAEKPGRGRFREFFQCDADIIGAAGPDAEVEILSVGVGILKALHVGGFTISMNHRGVFDGLLAGIGVEDPEKKAEVIRTLDKLDKIGQERVMEILASEVGLPASSLERIAEFLSLEDGDLDAAKTFFDGDEVAIAALDSMASTLSLAQEMGIGDHLEVRLSIARGLDYYTGLIYETTLTALPDIGSVMSGGRYDGLMSMFGAPAHAAVGISLGVDRLYAALLELEEIERKESPTEVLVTVFDEESRTAAFQFTHALRAAGVAAEVHLGNTKKFGKQFRYADKKQIPYVAILGPDERAEGKVRIRTLADGSEQLLSNAEAIQTLASTSS